MSKITLASALLLLAGCAPEHAVGFTVRFVDAMASPELPLAGLEVCVDGRPEIPCATADADGRIAMRLPAHDEVMLRCASATHGPAYMTIATTDVDLDPGRFSILRTESQDGLVALSGATSWPLSGAVAVNVYTELDVREVRVAGVTVTTGPDVGGTTYVSEMRFPDQALEATTVGGPAVVFDVEPGTELEVTVHHPSLHCRGGFGWPGATEASLRTRAFAGGISFVTFVCD